MFTQSEAKLDFAGAGATRTQRKEMISNIIFFFDFFFYKMLLIKEMHISLWQRPYRQILIKRDNVVSLFKFKKLFITFYVWIKPQVKYHFTINTSK